MPITQPLSTDRAKDWKIDLPSPQTRFERDQQNFVDSLAYAAKNLVAKHFTPVDGAKICWEMPQKFYDHVKRAFEDEWLTNMQVSNPISFMGTYVVVSETDKMRLKATRKKYTLTYPEVKPEIKPPDNADWKEKIRSALDERLWPVINRTNEDVFFELDIPYKPMYVSQGLLVHIKSRAQLPWQNVNDAEIKAVETLREIITEEEYRRYLKYGFILVPGASGATYQIFRNQSHTKVWRAGRIIEEVCVRLSGQNIPETDNVIAFKRMIEINEEEFKKSGNLYKFENHNLTRAA